MAHELEERDENDLAYQGPYDGKNKDAFGHPLNAQGRCELLNENPPQCPPEEE